MSGRYNIALGLIAALILIPFSPIGRWVEPKGPAPHDPASWTKGSTTSVRITIITADYDLLTCASETALEGAHCAYKSRTEVWPRAASAPLDDNKANIIQPYRTSPDNKLVLVAGLWAHPVVAMRLHREPSQGVSTKKLIRFVASCEMKVLGRLDNVELRWNNSADWTNEGGSPVVRPISCKIEESEDDDEE
jgi:hypothetical protein